MRTLSTSVEGASGVDSGAVHSAQGSCIGRGRSGLNMRAVVEDGTNNNRILMRINIQIAPNGAQLGRSSAHQNTSVLRLSWPRDQGPGSRLGSMFPATVPIHTAQVQPELRESTALLLLLAARSDIHQHGLLYYCMYYCTTVHLHAIAIATTTTWEQSSITVWHVSREGGVWGLPEGMIHMDHGIHGMRHKVHRW